MNENQYAQADPAAAAQTTHAFEMFRHVVAGHLVEMFLDSKSPEVHEWARAIATELRRADVGIDDDLMRRLRNKTLGPDPDEPPF